MMFLPFVLDIFQKCLRQYPKASTLQSKNVEYNFSYFNNIYTVAFLRISPKNS